MKLAIGSAAFHTSVNPIVIEMVSGVVYEAAVHASDVVVTMGCGDECPFYPGKRYLDWALPDPAGQGVDAVRPIRDEIDRRVRALLRELVDRGPSSS